MSDVLVATLIMGAAFAGTFLLWLWVMSRAKQYPAFGRLVLLLCGLTFGALFVAIFAYCASDLLQSGEPSSRSVTGVVVSTVAILKILSTLLRGRKASHAAEPSL